MSRQDRIEWFQDLNRLQSRSSRLVSELLAEMQIEEQHRVEMEAATIAYVAASLEKPNQIDSGNVLLAELDGNIDQLANRTPNGHLRPKRELENEFNQLHAAVSRCVQSWGFNQIFSTMFAPLTVRVVNGAPNPPEETRPYSSTKIHVDLWAGEPADSIDIFIPILGDIQRTTIEFFVPPDDFDDTLILHLGSYDEGGALLGDVPQVPLELKHGYAYFSDAIVPHRTIKQGGTTRITLQIAVRRPSSEEERSLISKSSNPGKSEYYIPPKQWLELGHATLMTFKETYSDAKRGVFPNTQYDKPIYVKAS